MTDSAQFWDRIAEKYAKHRVADPASYQKKLAITRTYMTPGMTVLEVGCGTGTTALHHAPAVKHIRAVDIAPRMIAIARDKAAAAGVTNVTFECTAIDDLAVADGSIDMVMAHSILHLVENHAAVIARLRRTLTPGGVFVSSTVCLGDNPVVVVLFAIVGPLGRAMGKLPLLRLLRRKHLEDSIRQAGFTIEQSWKAGSGKAVFVVARKV